jgi:SNF2 family DNA or RNA helicase
MTLGESFMFGGIKNLFGIITASENKAKGTIVIDGIPADFIKSVILEVIKLKKINRWLFLDADRKYQLEFYSFFAIEVLYIFKEILDKSTNYRAKRILTNVVAELEKHTWISNVERTDIPSVIDLSLLSKIKWELKPHQLEFLKRFGDTIPRYELMGMLLASPPGTGKTIMDLAVAAAIIPQEVAEVKIIISPKNAIELVWEDTIDKVFHEQPTSWVSNVSGPAPDGMEYYVFHYEALDRALELVKRLVEQGKKYFVIIDESHNFNEVVSKRTQLLIDLCLTGNAYSIWASGSPMKKSKLEMIPLLRSIDRKFTEQVESIFKKIYGGDEEAASQIMYHRLGFYAYKIAKTVVMEEKAIPMKIQVKLKDANKYLLTSIAKEMKEFIEARLKEIRADIVKYNKTFDDCIEEHRRTLKTDIQRKNFKLYETYLDRARKNSMATRPDTEALQFCKKYETETLLPSLSKESQKAFKECRSIVKSLLLKLRGEALGRVVTKRRAECAAELAVNCGLEDIISNGIAKSMVFSTYTDPLDTANAYLKKKGFETACVYGDTAKDVTKIVRKFHDDDDVNPIIATYASLSTAVPVLAANQVILLDIPFRNYILDQTVSRALRIGQTNPVYLYSIVLDTGTEPNISTRAGAILAACQKEIAACLGEAFGGISEAEYDVTNVEEVEDVDIDDSLKRVESTM